jgi:hypothetical protein
MRRRAIWLATAMFAVLLVAANLTAFRSLAWPGLAPTSLNLGLSLLPMVNALAILGYRLIHNPAQGRNLHVRLLYQRRRCPKNARAVFDLVLVRQPLS